MKSFSFFILTLFILASCKTDKYTQKDATSDNIQIDSTALFYYIKPKHSKNAPVVYFIDPHGNGKLPLKKYQKLAIENKIILVGLTNVKNNDENFLDHIGAAREMSKKVLDLSPEQKVFMTGFSGGARMALYSDMTLKLNGILMCGAGPGNINLQKLKSPIAIITGTKDFNFSESYYPPESNISWSQNNLISLHFRGKHEWPPYDYFKSGLLFLFQKSDIKNIEKPEFVSFVHEINNASDILSAYKQAELGLKTSSEEEIKKYNTKLRGFSQDKKSKQYFTQLGNVLNNEMKRNNELIKALKEQDVDWWNNELVELQNGMKDTSDILQSDSYYRTKALLGVVLFSNSNMAVRKPLKEDEIEKYLQIYENFEPENPDVQYLKALHAYKNGDDYKEYLIKAKELGYENWRQIKTDFNDSAAVAVIKTIF